MTELESTLHKYLMEEVFHDQQLNDFTSDTPLISSELADSIALVQIVAFIEQVIEVNVPEEELLPENFETVNYIMQMINKLKGINK
jgi:acyl carrier protein